ncbi:hypothetical protein P7D22_04060 [Lichenihabitans sp. Uapishka_5]|uniref:hypothetical protein n=1 Tax=Lichenihabitans sp. Uapishka_5 TaxID=3037302 RepID=UPI0029E7D9A1|nr:hypothetical protein [Lichenihabitans sp. Uapishka_5]MDX7950351.1 hypothetical protein [Lichenihabitans sp. Uapishka_5]
MTFLVENEQNAYARLIADGLRDVLEELHAIDLVDLVSFIRFDRHAAIEDLLQSSTELFFKEGTITFGWNAWVDMAWGDMPSVTLGMEFNHRDVCVFFNLTLRAMEQAVEVVAVVFDPECPEPAERRRRLKKALSDALLPRAARRLPVLPLRRGSGRAARPR